MEVSSTVTDVPSSYNELSFKRDESSSHTIVLGEREMRMDPNDQKGTYSTFQRIPSLLSRGTKRRSRWQSRTCLSDNTNQQQHNHSPLRNKGFLLMLGLISSLLQVCSAFALVPFQHHHHHHIVCNSHSRLYAIETEPSSRVRRKSGEEDTLLLPTYYDDEENKLARRLSSSSAPVVSAEYPEESQGAPFAQEEGNDDSQEDDNDSEKEIIMDDENDDEDDDVQMAAQRRAALKRAALLGRKSGAGYRSTARASAKGKSTSVGERKVGSATKARHGIGASSRIIDTVRKTVLGTSAAAEKKKNSDKEEPSTHSVKGITTRAQIHSTIEDILKIRRPSMRKPPTREEYRFAAAVSLIGRGMGIFGDTKNDERVAKRDKYQVSKAKENPWTIDTNNISVRAATPSDDVDIACLRLSVFSDISPDVQNQFVTRSCQAIANRRMRGAKCVVATVPLTASGSRSSNHLLGSAECSFHEFFSTKLGQRRPQHSILYVTEFAVNPAARRRGIGLRLLNSLHEQAQDAETLYLHVDVTNRGAIRLYEKAGYSRVKSDDPMYMDFTTSLNLHPGATKGRVHHLYYKDLVEEPTWLDNHYEDSSATIQKDSVMGNLGFVVP